MFAFLDSLPFEFEFIIIDNARNESMGEKIIEIYDRNSRWKYLRFCKNINVKNSKMVRFDDLNHNEVILAFQNVKPQL